MKSPSKQYTSEEVHTLLVLAYDQGLPIDDPSFKQLTINQLHDLVHSVTNVHNSTGC